MADPIEVKLLGFGPDLDITTPGVILNNSMNSFIPTINGVGPVKSLVSAGFPALAAACRGSAVVRKIDDSSRFFAGTQTKLYEGGSGAWTDVSVGGGVYAGGAENLWRFAQFGNDTIATNRTDPVQMSSGSGAFANLAGTPPKASIVEVCNGFVLLFDYNDGSNDYPDGWWCSALQDDASWSASIATQAANGRLLDVTGKIYAARKLGDVMVAYKQRSMFLGTYQGPPFIWDWKLIPGDVGAVSQEAVVPVIIDDVPCHIFAGFDGFYIFDGTRPRFIGKELKKWYNTQVSAQYRYRIKAMHDALASNIYFFLPDNAGNLSYCVVVNYRSNRWGNIASISPIEAAVEYLATGTTYDGLGSLYSTFNDMPSIAYDSPFWTSGAPVPAVFSSAHLLSTYTGAGAASYFQCGFSGDAAMYQTLIRVRPRFNIYPDSGTGNVSIVYTPNLGTTLLSTSSLYSLNKNKYDMQISSRFFSPAFATSGGDFEQTGYTLYLEQDGEE